MLLPLLRTERGRGAFFVKCLWIVHLTTGNRDILVASRVGKFIRILNVGVIDNGAYGTSRWLPSQG